MKDHAEGGERTHRGILVGAGIRAGCALPLVERRAECRERDDVMSALYAEESRALVVIGEPGIGKTALLDHLVERAAGCRVLRGSGIEAEQELAFAALHRLCAPLRDRNERLLEPRRAALRTAFGLDEGPAPDQFLVGLAAMDLFAEATSGQPLLCILDDAQWLDRASVQALAFAARWLAADSVALVFATRSLNHLKELAGLTQLPVRGLDDVEARTLLESVLLGRVNERGLAAMERAGEFDPLDEYATVDRVHPSFRNRLATLPDKTRLLSLLAAPEPLGDPDHAQLYAELTASRARILAAADHARRCIERDLHDGAQQRLVSLALRLRAAQASVPPEAEELAGQLGVLVTEVTSTLDELRELARGVHPVVLAEGGLAPALEALARRSAIPVKLNVSVEGRLPEQVEIAAYYVVSEALTNAAKHAAASIVQVHVDTIERDGIDQLQVKVCDDGRGGAALTGGTGLLGLKDRAEGLGGRIYLDSLPGSGTTLGLELPLSRNAGAPHSSREQPGGPWSGSPDHFGRRPPDSRNVRQDEIWISPTISGPSPPCGPQPGSDPTAVRRRGVREIEGSHFLDRHPVPGTSTLCG